MNVLHRTGAFLLMIFIAVGCGKIFTVGEALIFFCLDTATPLKDSFITRSVGMAIIATGVSVLWVEGWRYIRRSWKIATDSKPASSPTP